MLCHVGFLHKYFSMLSIGFQLHSSDPVSHNLNTLILKVQFLYDAKRIYSDFLYSPGLLFYEMNIKICSLISKVTQKQTYPFK